MFTDILSVAMEGSNMDNPTKTVKLNACECEHSDHFPNRTTCTALCEACLTGAHALISHPYGAESPAGVRIGAGALYYCPACATHEADARRFA